MLKPLLQGIKVAPFVECPNCRTLTKYGADKCSGCSEGLNIQGDTIIYFGLLGTGQRYTPFIECPNCRKLVKVGTRRCPDCYEEITEDYAIASALAVVVITMACDIASSIRGFDSFAVIAVIGSVLIYASDLYIFGSFALSFFILLWSLLPLFSILLWFYRCGGFDVGNDDYLSSKRDMGRSLKLWLTILAAQLLALAVGRSYVG